MAGLVRDHWFRVSGDTYAFNDPCVYRDCRRPRRAHVEAVGEWMDAQHVYLPWLTAPVWCRRCGRNWRHSTHMWISPKWRQLHRK